MIAYLGAINWVCLFAVRFLHIPAIILSLWNLMGKLRSDRSFRIFIGVAFARLTHFFFHIVESNSHIGSTNEETIYLMRYIIANSSASINISTCFCRIWTIRFENDIPANPLWLVRDAQSRWLIVLIFPSLITVINHAKLLQIGGE